MGKQNMFCKDDCEYLSPTEKEQSVRKEHHRCHLYKVILRHGNYHPKIIAVSNCKLAEPEKRTPGVSEV